MSNRVYNTTSPQTIIRPKQSPIIQNNTQIVSNIQVDSQKLPSSAVKPTFNISLSHNIGRIIKPSSGCRSCS